MRTLPRPARTSSPQPSPARRGLRATALLAVAAMLLAACGGADDDGAPAAAAQGQDDDAELTELVIAEPVHGLGYLPLYVGIQEGFFAEEGLEVTTLTLQGGGAHTNAVLTGEAWAFIGGPEHNAFAAARGDESVIIKAVANVVNRGNVYLVAAPGLDYDGDLASFLTGKTLVTNAYGSTPNSITRYLLQEHGLEDGRDLDVIESVDASAALAIVEQGQAEIAMVSEPILGRGVAEGIWQEPFYNVPLELGPYAYSTINVRLDSIESDPETVHAFARAMVRALALTEADPELAFEIATIEFPTLEADVLQATLDRAYADHLWEFSGTITTEALEMGLEVVRAADILDDAGDPVLYDSIVDMTFIEAAGG